MSRFRKLSHAIWHCQYHIVGGTWGQVFPFSSPRLYSAFMLPILLPRAWTPSTSIFPSAPGFFGLRRLENPDPGRVSGGKRTDRPIVLVRFRSAADVWPFFGPEVSISNRCVARFSPAVRALQHQSCVRRDFAVRRGGSLLHRQ